jgi:CheY-like chemotaxis protein
VLNILLVEDNRINQQVALTMLKKWGYRIDVAWNGLEALEAVQRQDYDLVLMDIQMPEMDGITTTQKIRQLDGNRASVPIVAVTANVMQDDRERLLAAGIDDYISKPIDRDTFQRVVYHYASQEQRAQTERPEENTEAKTGAPLLGDEVLSYLLHELSGEIVSELIDEYMTHSTDLLSQALVASEEQDAKNVEYAVHTLKGMSGALGAIRMVDICQEILETCRNQWTQEIEYHMNDLSGITEETQRALQAWRFEHKSC